MSREMLLLSKDAELSNQLAAAKEMNYGLRKASGELERQNCQLRVDMQSLNDLYYVGHKEFLEAQIEVKSLLNVKEQNKHLLAQVSQLDAHLEIARNAQTSANSEKDIIMQQHQLELNKILRSNAESQRMLESTVQGLQLKTSVLQDREMMGSEDRLAVAHRFDLFSSQAHRISKHRISRIRATIIR